MSRDVRDKRVLVVLEDVRPWEMLDFHQFLEPPQIVFSGMVQEVASIALPGQQPMQVRPKFDAWFLIPLDYMNDAEIGKIGRRMPDAAGFAGEGDERDGQTPEA